MKLEFKAFLHLGLAGLLVIGLGACEGDNTPQPQPTVKGPCQPGGRPLNPNLGETSCAAIATTLGGCNACCKNNGNTQLCNDQCRDAFRASGGGGGRCVAATLARGVTVTVGQDTVNIPECAAIRMADDDIPVDGDIVPQTLTSSDPLYYVPASVRDSLALSGLDAELVRFLGALQGDLKVQAVAVLSQMSYSDWQKLQGGIPDGAALYSVYLYNYLTAWNLANKPAARNSVYWNWFEQSLMN